MLEIIYIMIQTHLNIKTAVNSFTPNLATLSNLGNILESPQVQL